ncbi:MAG TPA: hypothetical protein DEX33_02300, partial [Cellvibrionales bacterium]|nr:hypothetical protein [Cellvibrionales bacterium]
MKLHILFYLFVFLISACGGGKTQVNSVYKTTLEVYLIDQDAFQLNWQDANNATYYQVFKRDPDGASFQQVGSDIAAGKQSDGETYYFSAESNSEFKLKSCNAQSCKTSSIVTINSPPTLNATMDNSEILQFNWLDASYATHYKVSVKYDGDNAFTPLSGDIIAGEQSFQVAAALLELQDAQFQLETCNASGCVATFTVGLAAAPLRLSFNAPLV